MNENSENSASAEEARLGLLRDYVAMDGARNPAIDEIVHFATQLCKAPIGTVSLIERDLQWFAASVGVDQATETPREQSFCAFAMLGDDVMVVPDAEQDPRFAQNPLVTGEPRIRFYAGAPLRSPEGAALGALCVIDTQPRDGLTQEQRAGLSLLARQVMAQWELRRFRRLSSSAEQALGTSESVWRSMADAIPQLCWMTDAEGWIFWYNQRWFDYTGTTLEDMQGWGWRSVHHPDHVERVVAYVSQCFASGTPWEDTFPLRGRDGQYRWFLSRALPIRNESGAIIRWFGTNTDVTEQFETQAERALVAQELSHRIKNIFAVVSGIIGLSVRAYPQAADFATQLRERLAALGRAHDFVRPHSLESSPHGGEARLQDLLVALFAPYANGDQARVLITGDDLVIDARAATPLSLLFHELATNATKYGALSRPDGVVLLHGAIVGDRFEVEWKEKGGPPVSTADMPEGFGTRLSKVSVEAQLKGQIFREWEPDGLKVRVSIPIAAIAPRSR